MTPLLIALALGLPAPPASLPPPPQISTVSRSFERPAPGCVDIDPSFVIDVAPPKGSGPLWAVRQPIARVGPDAPFRLGEKIPMTDTCPRLRNAAGRR